MFGGGFCSVELNENMDEVSMCNDPFDDARNKIIEKRHNKDCRGLPLTAAPSDDYDKMRLSII